MDDLTKRIRRLYDGVPAVTPREVVDRARMGPRDSSHVSRLAFLVGSFVIALVVGAALLFLTRGDSEAPIPPVAPTQTTLPVTTAASSVTEPVSSTTEAGQGAADAPASSASPTTSIPDVSTTTALPDTVATTTTTSTTIRPVATLACPIEEAVFTDDWGFPRANFRVHEGIDVFGARRARLVAIAAGTVVRAGEGPAYGLHVLVELPDGTRHFYTALSSIDAAVQEGTVLAAGDQIGRIGNSGNYEGITSHHLHFEILTPDGERVPPYPLMVEACG